MLNNPLHDGALTADTVEVGQRIVVYVPGLPDSARRYKVLSTSYVDDDGDRVIALGDKNGDEKVFLTSEAGLSGGRYDGIWTHVAVEEDEL